MSRWPGTWKAICDVCGFEFYSDELKQRWDGLMVCSHDWEPRHPQDFVRGVPDNPAPPWVRSEPPDEFIHVCDIIGVQPWADYAVAGCATVGSTFNFNGSFCPLDGGAYPNMNFANCMVAEQV